MHYDCPSFVNQSVHVRDSKHGANKGERRLTSQLHTTSNGWPWLGGVAGTDRQTSLPAPLTTPHSSTIFSLGHALVFLEENLNSATVRVNCLAVLWSSTESTHTSATGTTLNRASMSNIYLFRGMINLW